MVDFDYNHDIPIIVEEEKDIVMVSNGVQKMMNNNRDESIRQNSNSKNTNMIESVLKQYHKVD